MVYRFRVLILILIAALASCGWSDDPREVTTSSDAAYKWYGEGTANMERFHIPEARDCFLAAVKEDSCFSMAWARLAIAQRQLDGKEESNRSIEKAWECRETASEVESEWIGHIHAIINREYDEAEQYYTEMVERFPDHPLVLRLRSARAMRENDFDTALSCYDEILKQNPDAVSVHNDKGYLYLAQGEYEKAVQSLQRYAYYNPDQANPHDSLGEAFLRIGRYEESIKEFRKALEIDPAFVWSARNLAVVLSITGQTRKALLVLDRMKPAFEERGYDEWWTMTRTEVFRRAQRWEDVIALADESLARLGESGDVEKTEYELYDRYAKTMALLGEQRMEEAKTSAGELARIADEVREKGMSSDLERPRQIMDLNEAATRSRFSRALGTPEEGIPRLKTALAEAKKISPDARASFVRELAEAQLAAGLADDAIATAQTILDVIPTEPGLNLVAAKASAEKGDRDGALARLQVYLEVMRNADPDDPRVTEATALLEQLVPQS